MTRRARRLVDTPTKPPPTLTLVTRRPTTRALYPAECPACRGPITVTSWCSVHHGRLYHPACPGPG